MKTKTAAFLRATVVEKRRVRFDFLHMLRMKLLLCDETSKREERVCYWEEKERLWR